MVAITSVLIPIYLYPCFGAWTDIYTNITSNPSTTFSIIINPNSGPGPSPIPDSNFITTISQLNSYNNTELYGYVHTSWANRPIAEAQAEVATYHNWSTYLSADIQLNGIFFDEAPVEYNSFTSPWMTNISSFARTTMGDGHNKIIFNPGAIPDSRFYTLADTIVAFENSWTAWSEQVLGWIGAEWYNKTAVVVHDFNGTVADQEAFADELKGDGLGSLFISTQSNYNETSALWTQFCEAMSGGC